MYGEPSLKEKISFIEEQFLSLVGYKLNIFQPTSFNEKIQWLKLFHNDPLLSACSDKWSVRSYISEKIGPQFLVPALGVFHNVEDIPFQSFLTPVVFKLTNGSGEVLFWDPRDVESISEVKKTLLSWLDLRRNHYFYSYEWWYKNLPSRIICEKVLADDIADYKFMCFNGTPKLVFTCTDRRADLRVTFFDLDWKVLPFGRMYQRSESPIPCPTRFAEMVNIAGSLAKPFPFVRVDFYEHEGQVYVGELTFGPGNGMEPFDPIDWDVELGGYLELPNTFKIESEAKFIEGDVADLPSVVAAVSSLSRKFFSARLPKYNILYEVQSEAFSQRQGITSGNVAIKKICTSSHDLLLKLGDVNELRNAAPLPDSLRFGSTQLAVFTSTSELDRLLSLGDDALSEQIDLLLEVRPDFEGYSLDELSVLVERLIGKGYAVYATDEREHCLFRVDGQISLAMAGAHHRDSFFYLLCVPKKLSLSVAFFAHSAELGGAERSLVDLVHELVSRGVICNAVLPYSGPLRKELIDVGAGVFIPEHTGELWKGWCWANRNGDCSGEELFKALRETDRVILPTLSTIGPDVICSQTIVSPWGAYCAERLSIPHALSVREYGELDHGLKFLLGFKRSISAFYESSSKIFCVTNDVQKTLFGDDTARKTSVVYSGLNPEYISKQSFNVDSLGDRHDLIEAQPRIGIFGSICAAKGQLDLIRACISLARRGKTFSCYIVGHVTDRAYEAELKGEIESSGFRDYFVFEGFSPQPYALMGRMSVVISCSVREAFGRSLIEALFLGVPIIYSDRGGSAEIYENEEHGLAYNPGDWEGLASAIEYVLDNPVRAKKLADQGAAYLSERFGRDLYVSRISEGLVDALRLGAERSQSKGAISGLLRDYCVPSFTSKLYIGDSNHNFSEMWVTKGRNHPLGIFDINFEISDFDAQFFRFDPVEYSLVSLELFEIFAETAAGERVCMEKLIISANGSEIRPNKWEFQTADPQVFIESPYPLKYLRIWGKIEELSMERAIYFLNRRDAEISELNQRYIQASGSLVSREERITELSGLIAVRDEEVAVLNGKVIEQGERIEIKERELAEVHRKMNSLVKSHSWRITVPLRTFNSYRRYLSRNLRNALRLFMFRKDG